MIDRAVSLLEPMQPFLIQESIWIETRDANPTALSLFHRHYSFKPYRDGRKPLHFVGPGEKMVLITPEASALFVWRKFKSGDGQIGVNCAAFRNEGPERASDLILEAEKPAWRRWPGERLYTYVNDKKVRRSRTPGRCFLKAGWRYVKGEGGKPARTKWNRLLILEKRWEWAERTPASTSARPERSEDARGPNNKAAELDRCDFEIQAAEFALRSGQLHEEELLIWLGDWAGEKRLIEGAIAHNGRTGPQLPQPSGFMQNQGDS